MEIKIIKTYDDEKLKWNDEFNEYELTTGAIKELVGNAFANDLVIKERARLTSMNIYGYIFSVGNTRNKRYTEFLLNRTKNGRKLLYKAFAYQIMADAQNGYNDITNQNAIDFNNGHVINREKIRENRITTNVEDLLANSQARLYGYNILAQHVYFLPQIDNILRLEDENN